MKFFEKNIKDRFKNASSLDGVDPDDLWNDIASSIPTESPDRTFPFLRKRIKIKNHNHKGYEQ